MRVDRENKTITGSRIVHGGGPANPRYRDLVRRPPLSGNPWKVMIRLTIACLMVLIAAGALAASGDMPCPSMEARIPAPASEVATIIGEWLTIRGCSVVRTSPLPGRIDLSARRSREDWAIAIQPQSALGAKVSIRYDGNAPMAEIFRQLREYIDAYLLGTASERPVDPASPHEPIPTPVLEKISAVVCINAHTVDGDVQFSGFLVDADGLILCTAHDLTDHQGVTVTFYDGTPRPGTILRLDLDRDLALVECATGGDAAVSLATARNLLGVGENVFSIGCPNRLGGTVAAGTINGPPRRVRDQPLWQVEMAIYPGSSGSPVFDDQGRLVAMVKGRYRGTSTLGFLTPLETIIAFLLSESDNE